MKKNKVSTSVPAFLSDFTSESNEKFSRGKLKVFYIGETADHRYFSEKFSKELIKTLPYAPVVSKYTDDDFHGHSAEQNIYGIVDPCKKPSFEKDDDGVTWAVCDVVLYTERQDEVGKVAKLIPGHAQSLEMDPRTAQYVTNYDSKMKLKNIEFTQGEIIGVSVLGDNQKPAFTGSAFFATDEDFERKMKILKDYCTQDFDNEQNERGKHMEKTMMDFLQLSWGEKSKGLFDALEARYGKYNVYPVDFYDDNVITYIYQEAVGESVLARVYYTTSEDGIIELGDAEEVRIVYEAVQKASTEMEAEEPTVEEPATEEPENVETPVEKEVVEEEEQQPAEETVVENVETEVEQNEEEAAENEPVEEPIEQPEENAVEEPVQDANLEDPVQEGDNNTTEEENVEEEEETPVVNNSILNNEGESEHIEESTTTNSSAFTDSERQELEGLRREKKLGLINSYVNDLSETTLKDFSEKVDSFTIEDLENELAKAYRKASKENNENEKPQQKGFKVFSFIPTESKSQQSDIASLVKQYKNKTF